MNPEPNDGHSPSSPRSQTPFAVGQSPQKTKEDELNQLRKSIEEKVASYVPDDQKDVKSDFQGTEMIPLKQLLFRFANSCDKMYLFIGALAAGAFGAVLPGFCLFFGEMIDDMGVST